MLVAGARRELRALTQFLLVHGAESLAEELEARLVNADAGRITASGADISHAPNDLRALRDGVDGIAISIQGKVRSLLEEPLPDLSVQGVALPSERLRNGVPVILDTDHEFAAVRVRHCCQRFDDVLGDRCCRTSPPSSSAMWTCRASIA